MSSAKPKRARSAYIFFCMKKREEVKNSLGEEARHSEVMIKLQKLWRSLKESSNQEDKKFLESLKEEANKDKERYANEVKTLALNKFEWCFLFFLQIELTEGRCPPITDIEYFIKNSLLCRIEEANFNISFADKVSTVKSLILISKCVVEEELLINIRESLVGSIGECTVCYTEGNVLEWPCHKSHITCEECIVKINKRCKSLPACPLCRVQTDRFSHYLDEMISAAETYNQISLSGFSYEDLLRYSAPHLSEEMITLVATAFPRGFTIEYDAPNR